MTIPLVVGAAGSACAVLQSIGAVGLGVAGNLIAGIVGGAALANATSVQYETIAKVGDVPTRIRNMMGDIHANETHSFYQHTDAKEVVDTILVIAFANHASSGDKPLRLESGFGPMPSFMLQVAAMLPSISFSFFARHKHTTNKKRKISILIPKRLDTMEKPVTLGYFEEQAFARSGSDCRGCVRG